MFEKNWFKWVAIGGSIGLMFLVSSAFLAHHALQERAIQRAKQAYQEQVREYDDKFRSTMVNVYQNLQLKHYFAAYQVIRTLHPPTKGMPDRRREYYEALVRIAQGLLDDDFMDEAEAVFQELHSMKAYEKVSKHSLDEIASKKRFDSAMKFLSQGKKSIDQKQYRDAANDLRKSKLEFESAKLYGVSSFDKEMKGLDHYDRIAKHYVHVQEARWNIEDAKKLLAHNHFEDVRKSMSKAVQHLIRAIYYNGTSPEVEELKKQLFNIQAELAYRVPNMVPIWNKVTPAQTKYYPEFFYLEKYDFDLSEIKQNKVRIAMTYKMRVDEGDYYVVRYKIFYFNGLLFFNGHFLMPKKGLAPEDSRKTVYIQDVPENFKGMAVKRIDLKIYDKTNQLLARINRVFRPPPSGS